jgi:uncharacterized membrane protein (UPF0127 family)
MRLLYEGRVLASNVEVPQSLWGRVRGLAGRDTVPPDYAIVFDEYRAGQLPVTTLGMRVSIDVVWTLQQHVVRVETVPPWRLRRVAYADRVIELRAGGADGVGIGDTLALEE